MLALTHENLIDPAPLLAECEGDPVILRKMIRSFHFRAEEHLAAMRAAAQRKDGLNFRLLAHDLRTLVCTYSPSISATVGALEHFPVDQPSDLLLIRCAVVADHIDALSQMLATLSVAQLQRLMATCADE